MAFVPDASVAAAWVLPDEEAALADLALDRLGEETAKVPGVFWHELRNLLLSAERRGRIDGRHADSSMVRLRRLRIRIADETDDREVMALVRTHRLTAYDASYLALASASLTQRRQDVWLDVDSRPRDDAPPLVVEFGRSRARHVARHLEVRRRS